MPSALRHALLTLALAGLGVSCTSFTGDPTVFVASTPQGARILVDGEDTGFTTPATLELGGLFGFDYEITLELNGHDPETRLVQHHTNTATSRWLDGACGQVLSVPWPLWWTLGDWFVPFEVKWQYSPHEVHAVLYTEGQAPVHSTGR